MPEPFLTITGLDEMQQRLAKASAQLPALYTRIFTDQLTQAVQYARTRYLSGGTTVDRLAQRTGGMTQAFTSDVTQDGQGATGRIGYLYRTPPGASVHEGFDGRTSTTIRPRTAKMLAIPIPGMAGELPGGPAGGPRTIQNSFIARSRAGNLIIFERTASGIQPRYLLRTSVTVPARPALRPTMVLYVPRIRDAVVHGVQQLLDGGLSG